MGYKWDNMIHGSHFLNGHKESWETWNHGTMRAPWFDQSRRSPEAWDHLAGGDWNHGILNDFPFSWEWKIIPTDEVHHFSGG